MKKNLKKNNDLTPYGIDKFAKIPTYVKVGFLKFFLIGAIYYYLFNAIEANLIGTGPDAGSIEVMILIIIITGLILGLIQEFIINNAAKAFLKDNEDIRKYIFVKKTKLSSLFLNLLYGIIIMAILIPINSILVRSNITITNLIALPFTLLGGLEPYKGTCPFTFGLIYCVIDYVFIFSKYGIIKLIEKKKMAKGE